MIYLDASAVLRFLLREAGALRELRVLDAAVSSALLRVEIQRTLDRLRVERRAPPEDLDVRQADLARLLEGIDLVGVDEIVLERAAHPMPLPLGTLDAIHLATALLWRERTRDEVVMATHDVALARSARLFGLPVIGA
ncbi:MAG: type II toxin-antitoxin system VapC family toxin [Myxococcota bacterium]